jgi:DNA-binding IclR family transcriptional regulator
VSVSLPHRVVLIMAHKYAQRRSADDLAAQLNLYSDELVDELQVLQRIGYVRRWSDGTWSLTSQGNAKRNQLTA